MGSRRYIRRNITDAMENLKEHQSGDHINDADKKDPNSSGGREMRAIVERTASKADGFCDDHDRDMSDLHLIGTVHMPTGTPWKSRGRD